MANQIHANTYVRRISYSPHPAFIEPIPANSPDWALRCVGPESASMCVALTEMIGSSIPPNPSWAGHAVEGAIARHAFGIEDFIHDSSLVTSTQYIAYDKIGFNVGRITGLKASLMCAKLQKGKTPDGILYFAIHPVQDELLTDDQSVFPHKVVNLTFNEILQSSTSTCISDKNAISIEIRKNQLPQQWFSLGTREPKQIPPFANQRVGGSINYYIDVGFQTRALDSSTDRDLLKMNLELTLIIESRIELKPGCVTYIRKWPTQVFTNAPLSPQTISQAERVYICKHNLTTEEYFAIRHQWIEALDGSKV